MWKIEERGGKGGGVGAEWDGLKGGFERVGDIEGEEGRE
jgi:hypothetical protein